MHPNNLVNINIKDKKNMLVIKHKDCAIRLNAIFYYDNTNKILC